MLTLGQIASAFMTPRANGAGNDAF